MQTGDKIEFGKYKWQVLDIEDSVALIITEDIVELRAYHNKPGDITWADCELRKYLNGEFFDDFPEEDKINIIPTAVVNCDNPWFGTIGGDDTIDRIFLLSIEEVVCKYFGDSSENLQIPNGKYKYWFTRKDINNSKRISGYLGHTWWWWLRSAGRKQVKAAYVHGDGNIGIQGNSALKCNLSGVYHPANNDVRGGVRPALWMKLKENKMTCEIRKWELTDAADLAEAISNKKVQDNLRDGLPYPYAEQDGVEYISAMLSADEDEVFAFAITADKKVIGSIGIFRQGNIHRQTGELGYYISEKYWGKGIMAEAIKQICAYVFDKSDIIRIYAEPFAFNAASCRVLEKAGFVYEGTLRNNAVKNGKVIDMKMYSLLKTEI